MSLSCQTKTRDKAFHQRLDRKINLSPFCSFEDLISLSGKIDIDLDWQKEEEAELNEYRDHNTTLRSDNRVRSAFWRP